MITLIVNVYFVSFTVILLEMNIYRTLSAFFSNVKHKNYHKHKKQSSADEMFISNKHLIFKINIIDKISV